MNVVWFHATSLRDHDDEHCAWELAYFLYRVTVVAEDHCDWIIETCKDDLSGAPKADGSRREANRMRRALKQAVYEVSLAYFIASEYTDFLRWAEIPPGLEHEMREIVRSLGERDKFPSQTLMKVMDSAAALAVELNPIWKSMAKQHRESWGLVMSEFERKKRG